MCLAQGPQRSDAGEARTRNPSVLIDLGLHQLCCPTENSRIQGLFQAFE